MLFEMECDAFATKVNGALVPRGKITFYEGLNTILGDKQAQNSIGKSTFLLIVDFCFGGDDYKRNNAKTKVGNHTIKFGFKDKQGSPHYFMRTTLKPTKVDVCDSEYNILKTISVDNFRDVLMHDIYQIDIPGISFRGVVGRFMRIYGKKNYDEQMPLANGGEKPGDAIIALEKLFGAYPIVKSFKEEMDRTDEEWSSYKSAASHHYIANASVVTSSEQLISNQNRIANLQQEIAQMEKSMDTELTSADAEATEKAAEIKGQITVLKRQRSKLLSQQTAVRISKLGGHVPSEQNMKALSVFFPSVNMKHLEEIERFHSKMQTILTAEVDEETVRLQALIDTVHKNITRLEAEQRSLGIPVKLPKAFLKKHAQLSRIVEDLQAQNREYEKSQKLAADAKAAKVEYDTIQDQQLRKVESAIYEEMVRINDFIYDGERPAPRIDLKKGSSYKFYTPDDDGTGTNFKGMIVFDRGILRLTQVPAIAHDSLIFKNIADLPIDKIFQLYQNSPKQIFVVFDKKDAFTQTTQDIIDATTVIELYENGGELFGWSWAKKTKEMQEVKETGEHSEE